MKEILGWILISIPLVVLTIICIMDEYARKLVLILSIFIFLFLMILAGLTLLGV